MSRDGIHRSSDFLNVPDTPKPSGWERCPIQTATPPEEMGFAEPDLPHWPASPAQSPAPSLPTSLGPESKPNPECGSFPFRSKQRSASPDGSLLVVHGGKFRWSRQWQEVSRPLPTAVVLRWHLQSWLPLRGDTWAPWYRASR